MRKFEFCSLLVLFFIIKKWTKFGIIRRNMCSKSYFFFVSPRDKSPVYVRVSIMCIIRWNHGRFGYLLLHISRKNNTKKYMNVPLLQRSKNFSIPERRFFVEWCHSWIGRLSLTNSWNQTERTIWPKKRLNYYVTTLIFY